jgi:glycosyltransferase involved in cell wall biosynthesis
LARVLGLGAPFFEQRNQEPPRPECEKPGRDERNRKQQTELSEGRCCDPHSGGFSFTILFHERNRGKGAALRTGFSYALGNVIVIQDADLEYDPDDWSRMLPLITDRKVADVVYGSRFYGRPHRSLYFHHYLGNRLISFLFNLLYNQMLSDVEVCYKMFSREVLTELKLTSDDFGFEIEISAQIARARRWRIYEVGISYYGRTYDEGKKINWRDGLKALVYLDKFRIS